MSTPTTIILADDHPIFRKGLKDVIAGEASIKVVGETGDGDQALGMILDIKPPIAVLDIDMPGKSGLEIVKLLREKNCPTDVILLTMYKEEDMFNEAMDLGVMGYVLKESAATDIVESIKVVASGKHYVSARMSEFLLTRSDRSKTLMRHHPALERLTLVERRILKFISEDKTSKEIADVLHISVKTVENHRTNIAAKLNLHGSHALLKFAIENKSAL
jgi:DNA-binding NarL/FixJ family response regulator